MAILDNELVELKEDVSASPLYNADLAPTRIEQRTWNKWNFAALWVAMSVCIPTYLLAADMLRNGLSWPLAIGIILAGNVIVAIPMIFNAHAGTKYGIPFPVFGRAVFGVYGIHVPSLVRAFVACGWFGIQCWVGGIALVGLVLALYDPNLSLIELTRDHAWLNFAGFGAFWLINMYFVYAGTESIKWLEDWSAPILLVIGLLLIGWAFAVGGGLGPVLDGSNNFSRPVVTLAGTNADGARFNLNLLKSKAGEIRANRYRTVTAPAGAAVDTAPLSNQDGGAVPFRSLIGPDGIFTTEVFVPGVGAGSTVVFQFASANFISDRTTTLTIGETKTQPVWLTVLFWLAAMVGYWATLALNIPDISRFAKSQADQAVGQFMGLPTTMMFYSFIGVVATSAAIIAFDNVLTVQDAPWDPATLISQISQNRFVLVTGQFALIIATLSTNIAANIISPANSFANVWPARVSFKVGGLIAGVIGILVMPWKLTGIIAEFLITYGSVLGPVVAVMIADYFVLRKTRLSPGDLFRTHGIYRFMGGFNPISLFSIAAGAVIVLLSGQFSDDNLFFQALSYGAWFSGFFLSMFIYLALCSVPAIREKILR